MPGRRLHGACDHGCVHWDRAGVSGDPDGDHVVIWPRRPSCIYVFSIAGPITEASALEFALRLRELPTRKPAACAVLLRVSSNGGSAEAIIEAVNLCREELGLPIVALVMERRPCRRGCCPRWRRTGWWSRPAPPWAEWGRLCVCCLRRRCCPLGVGYTAYASNALKDMFSHCADLAPEAEQALHELVRENGRQFMAAILACRPALGAEGRERLAAGQVLNGAEAVALGLADVVGGFTRRWPSAGVWPAMARPCCVLWSPLPPCRGLSGWLVAAGQRWFSP